MDFPATAGTPTAQSANPIGNAILAIIGERTVTAFTNLTRTVVAFTNQVRNIPL
jgi:hypothetical protein